MQANVGGIDRTLRIVIGSLLLLVTMTTNAIGLWGLLGMIAIVSGFMRFCPLYAIAGISTRKKLA
jgi:membrane-bound ClpP family serine protease